MPRDAAVGVEDGASSAWLWTTRPWLSAVSRREGSLISEEPHARGNQGVDPLLFSSDRRDAVGNLLR